MTATDTARRERAVKWILDEDDYFSDEDLAWARSATCSMEDDTHLCAYLAGSREEAAIKDAEIEIIRKTYEQEIAALKQNDANREALLDSLLRLRNEQILEIAALREFVSWHFMHHPQSWPGNAEIMPAVRRALKERP